MKRSVLLGMAGLAAVLVLYVVYAAWRVVGVELDESRLAGLRGQTADLPRLEVGAAPPAPDTLGDFIERPLFWEERRPPPPQDEAGAPEPQQVVGAPKDLEVTGVIRHGDEWFALGQYQGQPVRLREGDKVGGWQVERILADNVVFSASGQEYKLELFKEIKVEAARPAKKAAQARRAPDQRTTARSRILQQRAAQRAREQAAAVGVGGSPGQPEEQAVGEPAEEPAAQGTESAGN